MRITKEAKIRLFFLVFVFIVFTGLTFVFLSALTSFASGGTLIGQSLAAMIACLSFAAAILVKSKNIYWSKK